MTKTGLCALLLTATCALSADHQFHALPSTTGNHSALSGNCYYIGNTLDMDCTLNQQSVRKKISDKEWQSRQNDAHAVIEKALSTQTVESYVKSALGSTCKKIKNGNYEKREDVHEAIQLLIDLCKSPSKDGILKAAVYQNNVDRKTCVFNSMELGQFRFEQVSNTKWVSTNKPSGECGVVTVMELEQEDGWLWNFNQVRHYTNTESDFCKDLAAINEPIGFSWKGKESTAMQCEHIEFGF